MSYFRANPKPTNPEELKGEYIILSLWQHHSSARTVFACGNPTSVPLLAAVQ